MSRFQDIINIYCWGLHFYLENNNLLNESQYAYRNNSSTGQALVNVTEQIYKSINKGKIFSLFPKPLIA